MLLITIALAKEVKECTLWLLDHDYIPEDVAEILGVSKRSVARWRRARWSIYAHVSKQKNIECRTKNE